MQIDPDVLMSLDPQAHSEGVIELELPDMELEKPEEGYFEGLFPKGQVHLIGGASGSGKSTLSFQMYKALTRLDGEWLGRKTIPAAWAYVSGDRSSNSVKATQKRLGVDFKIFSLVDEGMVGADLSSEILPRLTKFYGYRPNFVYVDGFTSLCPGGKINDYMPVAKWLAHLSGFCQRKNLTILGACHTTKVREGETFTDPRQRIAGSVSWAAYTETVLLIESPGAKDDKGKRRVMLLPRNAPADMLNMQFGEDGSLQIADSSKDAILADRFVLDNLMNKLSLGAGEEIYYLKLWNMAKEKHVNRRTFDRWLAKAIEGGGLVRMKKGVYVKT